MNDWLNEELQIFKNTVKGSNKAQDIGKVGGNDSLDRV